MQNSTLCALFINLASLGWAMSGHANPAREQQKTSEICASAVRIQEHQDAIPQQLLNAISKAESGRWDHEKQANIAWPWTVTTSGTGKFFETKDEAVAAVELLRTNGVRNIDIGCMQINLAAHANAFQTIEQAFDPVANVAYGAKYLKIMHQRTGNWLKAAGGYHSMTPHLSAKYRKKITRIWYKLLRTQQINKKFGETRLTPNFLPRHSSSIIDYARLNQLNQNFRDRLALSTETDNGNPVNRLANRRLKQIAAWRNSQARGEDLRVLASRRQAEQAKRRKRELGAFEKGNQPLLFAKRRQQQLNAWRKRYITGVNQN